MREPRTTAAAPSRRDERDERHERVERIGGYVYAFHAPRALPATRRTAVAIVGGGPVGLACALGLARQGVGCVVVEADESVCVGSRALCVSSRSLEIVGRIGGPAALEPMLQRGLPWSGGRSFWQDREVFRFAMPESPDQRLPPMINLQQYRVEDALLAGIDALGPTSRDRVDILWATRAESIEPGDGGVRLSLANAHGTGALEADWVVACDGGQSFVRESLELELAGVGYEGRYVIVDIVLASAHPTERRAWFDPPWYRGGTILMHRQPDDLWRLDWQLRAGEDSADALQPERVRAFVQTHLDAIGEGHLPWEAVWTSVYRAGAMTLERYRHGRVLFAGNAAHAMPIFGVRGLNSGIDDADNLVWKLAAVVDGRGADALLDTYSEERVAAFHINADSARRSTEFMSPPGRGFELLREAALSLAEQDRAVAELVNPRQTRAVAYVDARLSTADDPGDVWRAGAAPGAVLPEAVVGGPTRHLTERVGPGFVLLAFGAAAAVELPAGVAAVDLGAPHGPLAATFDAVDGTGYLVRPDGHVAARWKRCHPEGVASAHRRALGHGIGAAGAAPATPVVATPLDRLYHRVATAVGDAGGSREPLVLARLALLLLAQTPDETAAAAAIDAALRDAPEPSLSAVRPADTVPTRVGPAARSGVDRTD